MIRYLLISFLFGCSSTEFHPNLVASWEEVPSIEICINAPHDQEFILDQFDWWHYEISNAYDYSWASYTLCEGAVNEGTIRVQKADPERLLELDAGAYTKRSYYYENSHLYSAIVNIQESNDAKIIRHEIGHAFGWKHFKESNHLMNKYGGCEIYGLKEYPPMN